MLPDFVDIYSPHYPKISTLRDYAARLQRPLIFTEYAHELGLASDRVQDEWNIMYCASFRASCRRSAASGISWTREFFARPTGPWTARPAIHVCLA